MNLEKAMQEGRVITVYYEAAEEIWDVDWKRLSGKTLYNTGLWDGTLIFVSGVHTYEQLEELSTYVEEALKAGADWDTFEAAEWSGVYVFELPDGRILRLVSIYA